MRKNTHTTRDEYPPELNLSIRLEEILLPHMRRRRQNVYRRNGRFAHYTTAEAALNIFQSKRIWMRNAACMTDYREVQHGFDLLNGYFLNPKKKSSFMASLNLCHDGVAEEAISSFNRIWTNIQVGTFISSISEHVDQEDINGRLSMWRAFGGNVARVAIIFRIPEYSGGADALHLLFSPVSYLASQTLNSTMKQVIQNVQADTQFLKTIPRESLVEYLCSMLVAMVICMKHIGFREEREWRVIYTPSLSQSQLMESSVEVLYGTPQLVHKIPLDERVSPTLAELDISNVFDRIIIGPSSYPLALYEAFVSVLRQSGIAKPETKVFVSGIPIRG